MFQAVEVLCLAQDPHQLIQVIPEGTMHLLEAHLTPRDMIEVLRPLTTEAKALLTIGLLRLEIIAALLHRLTIEVPARLTVTQDRLADPITTIHLHTALRADQALDTLEVAVTVLRAEARVDPQEEVATPEVPEEEGGINSPLFFIWTRQSISFTSLFL